MWLILMLLSWFTGAVMSTNPVPNYTVLDWELEFTDCTVPSGMARYQVPKRCLEPEKVISLYRTGTRMEPVYKGTEHIPGSDVSPGRITDRHIHTPIWTRIGLEIRISTFASRCLRFARVLSKEPKV